MVGAAVAPERGSNPGLIGRAASAGAAESAKPAAERATPTTEPTGEPFYTALRQMEKPCRASARLRSDISDRGPPMLLLAPRWFQSFGSSRRLRLSGSEASANGARGRRPTNPGKRQTWCICLGPSFTAPGSNTSKGEESSLAAGGARAISGAGSCITDSVRVKQEMHELVKQGKNPPICSVT
jgi:hypothetical protein